MIDPNKNRIPDDVKSVHLIAVCGTAMAALACMLKELGYAVTENSGIQGTEEFRGQYINFRPLNCPV